MYVRFYRARALVNDILDVQYAKAFSLSALPHISWQKVGTVNCYYQP
jgi:hypothetical protein